MAAFCSGICLPTSTTTCKTTVKREELKVPNGLGMLLPFSVVTLFYLVITDTHTIVFPFARSCCVQQPPVLNTDLGFVKLFLHPP